MSVRYDPERRLGERLSPDGTWVETRVVEDPKTGRVFASDGKKWVEVAGPPLSGEIQATVAGVNRGIANIAGLPGDVIQGMVNAGIRTFNDAAGTSVPETDSLGSSALRRLMERVGIDTSTEPKTTAGRYATRVAEEVGPTALTVGAGRAALAAADAGRMALGPVSRAVAETVGGNIPLQALGMTGAGVGAQAMEDAGMSDATATDVVGTGAGGAAGAVVADKAAQAVFPGSPLARLLAVPAGIAAGAAAGTQTSKTVGAIPGAAEMLGGVAGGVAASTAVPAVRYVDQGLRELVRPGTDEGRRTIAGRVLNRTAADRNAAVDRMDSTDPLVPGSQPTTAQVTNDTGLAVLERGLRASDPQAAGAFEARRADNQQARIAFLNQLVPSDDGNALTVADYLKQKLGAEQADGGRVLAAAQADVERRLQALGPGIDAQSAGQIIRGAIDDALRGPGGVKATVSRAFESIDPLERATIDVEGARGVIDRMLAKRAGPGAAPLPGELQGLVREFMDLEGEAPYAVLRRMQSRATQLAQTLGEAGQRNEAAIAREVSAQIDGAMAETASGRGAGNFTPAQRGALGQAREMRQEQGQRFEQGAVGEVLRERGGAYAVDASKVPGRLFRPQAPEALAGFVNAVGDNPQAVGALRDYAVSDMLQHAYDPVSGTVNPKALQAWADARRLTVQAQPEWNTQGLAAFQQVVDDVGNLARARRLAMERADQLKAGTKAFEDSAAGLFTASNPKAAVAEIVGSKDSLRLMEQLFDEVQGNPLATRGLQRAVVEHLIDTASPPSAPLLPSGETAMSPAKYAQAFARVRPLLDRAGFTPQQITGLERIADDMRLQTVSDSAGRGPGSNTIQNLSVANLMSALTGGVIDPAGLGGSRLNSFVKWIYSAEGGPEQRLRELLVEAALDPRLASDLMKRATPVVTDRILKSMADRAATTAAVATISGASGDPSQ
jgi:hypothetical protein